VVRVALQALAAVLGGTQSLHTNSFDEALALPTEHAVKVALRTQQIVAHESGVADCVDPLGGSYFVEYLTAEIEKAAKAYLEKIDAMGGVIRAIETGFIKQEIERSAYAYQKALETKTDIVVGLNDFIGDDENPRTLKIDRAVEGDQKARLRSLKAGRPPGVAAERLKSLESAARSGENLLGPIIAAAKANVTVGEMCDALRGVFGTFREAGRG
jgi:methylmalonyl-CoA mutase N-terminal domain/subunit